MSSAGEQIASSDAGKAIAGAANAAGGIAVGAAMGLAQGASSLASGAASTVEGGISAIKENSFSARLRKARIKGFRDGIKQGAYLAGQKRHNFIYAYVATLCFLMRCDGDFSQEEREWLEDGLDYLKLDGGLPDDAKAKMQAIADDEDLSFDRVKDCLAPRHPRRRARPACGRRREAPVARPQRGARHTRRRVRATVRRARGGARQVPSRPRLRAAGRSWSKWAGKKDLQLVRRPLFGYPESFTLARMAVIHTCRFRFAAFERAGGSLRHACCNNIIRY
ncbi:hypothetical protein [Olegusella massiliensis]|uniref:hypothetical protein n=1 Tax=Olegusella massiliensis TaxID=1776381 RepID=UPI0012DBFF4E|nr:hypothetical protein [Olegusella massiliensis]